MHDVPPPHSPPTITSPPALASVRAQEDRKRSTELWRFHVPTASWTNLTPSHAALRSALDAKAWPPGRLLHAAALLRRANGDRVMVVMGGLSQADTWLYDVERSAWQEHTSSAASPGIRHGAGATVWNGPDGKEGDQLLLIGGSRVKPLVMYNDAWLFDLEGGWRELQPNAYHPAKINTPVPLPGAMLEDSGSRGQ